MIPLGEWSPDLPDYVDLETKQSPHCIVAKNCLPQNGYFTSLNQISEVSTSALDSFCQGAAAFQANDLTTYIIAGDVAKLYRLLTDNTFDDVSAVGGYATPIDASWYYTQIQNRILATNFANNIQSYVMGSSTDFADLTGSPPKAKFIANLLNYVVVAYTTASPYTIQWCDQNDPTNWATGDARTVATVASSGQIQQVFGGKEYGIIMCQKAIYRMNFIGPPLIFQLDPIETEQGLLASGAAAQFGIGGKVFYLSANGFYVFTGDGSIPIGNNRVNNFFFNSVNTGFLYKIKTVVDADRSQIITIYPDGSSASGTPNRALIWNYIQDKWSYLDNIAAETIFVSRAQGYTIDTVDNVFATIDSTPYSFDSNFWVGGQLLLSTFTSNHRLGAFVGDPMTAIFESAEYAPSGIMNRSSFPYIAPQVVNAGATTVSMGTRNSQSNTVAYGGETMQNSNGVVPVRVNAKLIRARVTLTGGFDKMQGFTIQGLQKGAFQ